MAVARRNVCQHGAPQEVRAAGRVVEPEPARVGRPLLGTADVRDGQQRVVQAEARRGPARLRLEVAVALREAERVRDARHVRLRGAAAAPAARRVGGARRAERGAVGGPRVGDGLEEEIDRERRARRSRGGRHARRCGDGRAVALAFLRFRRMPYGVWERACIKVPPCSTDPDWAASCLLRVLRCSADGAAARPKILAHGEAACPVFYSVPESTKRNIGRCQEFKFLAPRSVVIQFSLAQLVRACGC
eukprot:scaffold111315_cov75-Phaeocystis_antarctica.AAC.1